MEKVKVVGYENFNSKKGNSCVLIHVIRDIVKRDSHVIVQGQAAESYYVPDHVKPKVSQALVGKEIGIYTAFYGNRNNLIDVVV